VGAGIFPVLWPTTQWDWYFLDIIPPADPWYSTVGNPEVWKNNVLDTLTTIAGSEAGQALLASLEAAAQWIMIVPPTYNNECNAHGVPLRLVMRLRTYTGGVAFDPADYMSGSFCYRLHDTKRNRPELPDEVLFHELIHAHRGSLRLGDRSPIGGGLFRYTNQEEFLAIVMTNIYISDKTNSQSGLRRDHVGNSPLEPELSTSLGFFQSSPQALSILRKFSIEQKVLFEQLARVNAVFNPLKALADPKLEHELEKLSRSRLALEREKSIPKEKRVGTPRPPLPKLDQLLKGVGGAFAQEALRVLRVLR